MSTYYSNVAVISGDVGDISWYGDSTTRYIGLENYNILGNESSIGLGTEDQPRPIGIRPLKNTGAGTVDDYFCYYIHWQFQDNGAIDDTTITIPQFAGSSNNFELDRSDGNSENPSCDIVIVRKSDRKAVRITGNMKNTSTLTFTDVSNSAVYPELLRLYRLGYI